MHQIANKADSNKNGETNDSRLQIKKTRLAETIEKYNEFYNALAHLFYAIAIADRFISRDERLLIIAYIKNSGL
jgi:hypothetical protein